MTPIFQDDHLQVWQGDCRDAMRAMPENSVHCVVTSPPYWGLRQYLFDGAVMLRNDLDQKQKEAVIDELNRLGVKPKC